MLEQIQEFLTTNSTMVLIAVVALVAIVGFFMFRRSSLMQSDLSNQSCDMDTGICQPHQQMQENIT